MKLKWWDVDTGYHVVILLTCGILLFCVICIVPYYAPTQNVSGVIQQTQDQTIPIAKMITQQQPRIDPLLSKPIADAVLKYSKKYNFPPKLIVALINRESKFRPMVVSSANCVGLMQINPPAHSEKLKKLGIKGKEIFHIDNNIHLGCMILREYYNSTKSIEKALTKYVGGKHDSYVCDILSNYTNLSIKK